LKAHDDIYELVRSLSAAEKRYLKIQLTKGTGKASNSMVLFEAIDTLEEYDEEKLRKKLKKSSFVKYLSAEKANLYDAIMRAMRSFHADRTIDTRIVELLQEERFLREKGLNGLRGKALDKAEALARKYERFSYLSEVLQAQNELITEFEDKKLSEGINAKVAEMEELSATRSLFDRLLAINAEVFMTVRSGADLKNPSNRNHIDTLASEVRASEHRLGESFRLQRLFHSTLGHYHGAIGELQERMHHSNAIVLLFDEYRHMQTEESQLYKTALANYLTHAHAISDYSRFEEVLKILRSLPTDSYYAEGEVFQNVYFLSHLYYINNGRFEDAADLVPEIKQGLETFARKINRSRELSFKYNIMVMYFLMHRFKEAREWSEMLLEEKSDIRQDLQTANRILYPVICYELGKFDLMESITRSAYRYLLGQQRLHDFERLVIRYLQSMPFSNDSVDFGKKLGGFSSELETLTEKRAVGFEEMTLWIRSKQSGRLMRELI
jgi:hypothetical protein